MSQLNAQQREAIKHADTPLLVLAGAGSGKTLVITRKIARLIETTGLDPQHVCAVTFTNKAAREMKSRVTALLPQRAMDGLRISTFHSLGLTIVRQELHHLGYRKGFSIFDTEDSAALIRELMRAEAGADKNLADQVRWQISDWKNALVSPAQALGDPNLDGVQAAAARVYIEYSHHLHAYNAFDFDDLIVQPVRLLRDNADVLAGWRERIRYLLVDEYQDTNLCQYELVKLLVGKRSGLTVVGDDDQSIYAWRGAQPQNLAQLARDFPDLKVVKLEQNYRSMGRILKSANTLIANNDHVFEKRLWSELGHGDPIRVLQMRDDDQEAERVVTDIQHRVLLNRQQYGDFAILYRSNHQARIFEKYLREYRIPYYLSGGTSFFERTEIKTVMAYLRLICNPDDDNAFLRVVNTPRREIGPTTLEKLGQYARQRAISLHRGSLELGIESLLNAKQLARLRHFSEWIDEHGRSLDQLEPVAAVKALLSELHIEDWLRDNFRDRKAADKRIENLNDLVDWIKRLAAKNEDDDLPAIVAGITLLGMLDQDNDAGDQVSLMTLHAAKGLEFPHVYIVGMEENILPHHSNLEGAGLEEERRLAYVGITRAQRSLTLSFAATRRRSGATVDCSPSRFLEELPRDDLQWEGRDPGNPQEKRERGEQCLAGLRAMLGDSAS